MNRWPPVSRNLNTVAVAALAAMAITTAHAEAPSQTTPDTTLRFGVASVRLSAPDAQFTSFSKRGAMTFTASNASLTGLLMTAFGVAEAQIAGLPKWAETANYDVTAKPPGDTPFTEEQTRQALQQLLNERLHLVVHHETRQVQGYRLEVAKDAPKLKPSKGGWAGRTEIDKNGTYASNVTLVDFASSLTSFVGNYPVVNGTGIKGSFEINLKFATNADDNSPLPSIFTAVQEQLGLKLVRAKVPLDMIVIDHVDRVPTEN